MFIVRSVHCQELEARFHCAGDVISFLWGRERDAWEILIEKSLGTPPSTDCSIISAWLKETGKIP